MAVSNYSPLKRTRGFFLQKWLIPDPGQGKSQVGLAYCGMPESKAVLQNEWGQVGGDVGAGLKGLPLAKSGII